MCCSHSLDCARLYTHFGLLVHPSLILKSMRLMAVGLVCWHYQTSELLDKFKRGEGIFFSRNRRLLAQIDFWSSLSSDWRKIIAWIFNQICNFKRNILTKSGNGPGNNDIGQGPKFDRIDKGRRGNWQRRWDICRNLRQHRIREWKRPQNFDVELGCSFRETLESKSLNQ